MSPIDAFRAPPKMPAAQKAPSTSMSASSVRLTTRLIRLASSVVRENPLSVSAPDATRRAKRLLADHLGVAAPSTMSETNR